MENVTCNNRSTGFKTTVVILLLLMLGLMGFAAHIVYNDSKVKKEAEEKALLENQPMTVEEALSEFHDIVLYERAYKIFCELPEVVVKQIYLKIGTEATVPMIVDEYLQNREEYISLSLAAAVKELEINGPDADKVKNITIGVNMKEEVPKKVPIIPVQKDSIATN